MPCLVGKTRTIVPQTFMHPCLTDHNIMIMIYLSSLRQSAWRHARGGVIRLWQYKTKSAQLYMGIYHGESVPSDVRVILNYNGFTEAPDEDSKEGKKPSILLSPASSSSYIVLAFT